MQPSFQAQQQRWSVVRPNREVRLSTYLFFTLPGGIVYSWSYGNFLYQPLLANKRC